MTLSRGLTNAAFVEDLEADERMARVRGDREESSRKEERRTNMRLARCLASWLVHTSTSKGRGRGQGLTPYPPTLRVARHQAAYPLPPYPKCPDATLPYPPAVPNPARRDRRPTLPEFRKFEEVTDDPSKDKARQVGVCETVIC